VSARHGSPQWLSCMWYKCMCSPVSSFHLDRSKSGVDWCTSSKGWHHKWDSTSIGVNLVSKGVEMSGRGEWCVSVGKQWPNCNIQITNWDLYQSPGLTACTWHQHCCHMISTLLSHDTSNAITWCQHCRHMILAMLSHGVNTAVTWHYQGWQQYCSLICMKCCKCYS